MNVIEGVAMFKSWAIDTREKKDGEFLAHWRTGLQVALYTTREDARMVQDLKLDDYPRAKVVRVQVTVKIVGE